MIVQRFNNLNGRSHSVPPIPSLIGGVGTECRCMLVLIPVVQFTRGMFCMQNILALTDLFHSLQPYVALYAHKKSCDIAFHQTSVDQTSQVYLCIFRL